jgi:carboxylesterase type B
VNVTIPSGTIIGNVIQNVKSVNGIPFANPPIVALRLRPPKKLSRKPGTYDATGVAVMYPQGSIFSTPSSDIWHPILRYFSKSNRFQ